MPKYEEYYLEAVYLRSLATGGRGVERTKAKGANGVDLRRFTAYFGGTGHFLSVLGG